MFTITIFQQNATCYEISQAFIRHGLTQPAAFNRAFLNDDTTKLLKKLAESEIHSKELHDKVICDILFGINTDNPRDEIAALILKCDFEFQEHAQEVYSSVMIRYENVLQKAIANRIVIPPNQDQLIFEDSEQSDLFDDSREAPASPKNEKSEYCEAEPSKPIEEVEVKDVNYDSPDLEQRDIALLNDLANKNNRSMTLRRLNAETHEYESDKKITVIKMEASHCAEIFECEAALMGIPDFYPPSGRFRSTNFPTRNHELDLKIPLHLHTTLWALLSKFDEKSPIKLKLSIQIANSKYSLLDIIYL
ncbi:hypothetical protein [Limnobacter sp.]|uniref:hypothetical protein n=1 Tax=Limnobacter sp. TaxID=2003368 RepID=UPI0025B8E266|nr:hypothetical protein [Limnobacter sp.]